MKNEAKLKQWGMDGKVRYYYLKYGLDKNGRATQGTATVCVIELPAGHQIPGYDAPDHQVYVRGVAFCSPKDQFVRKHGRPLALGRAVKAIESHQCSNHVPNKTPAGILASIGWFYFSAWNPILTEYEKKLFGEVPK